MIKIIRYIDKSKTRLDICKSCENFNSENYKCKLCGCFMKAKVLFPNTKCPINKWGPEVSNAS